MPTCPTCKGKGVVKGSGDPDLAEKWFALNRKLRRIIDDGPTEEWSRLIREARAAEYAYEQSKWK